MEERKNSDYLLKDSGSILKDKENLGLQIQNITKSMNNENDNSFSNLEIGKNIILKENISLISKFLFKKVFETNLTDSSFDEIYKNCEKKNKKFIDRVFPPNETSLIRGNHFRKNDRKWKKIKWIRASDYRVNATIFPEKFYPREIKQGALNNCSFLSVIAALAENSDHVHSMFITDKTNPYGIYGVYLCKDGEKKQIIIDDYFPCDNKMNIECFSTGCTGTLWVQILEKCYAKAYGSYSNSETKDIERIIQDLTCAPIISLDNSYKHLYSALSEAYENNWLIIASAGDTEASQELLKEIGLVPTHAYAILKVFTLTGLSPALPPEKNSPSENLADHDHDDTNFTTLLKIRNHWLKDGWLGDWSEGSHLWTDEIKEKVGYTSDDSCFYMNLKDFKHYFSKIKICKVFKDYNYTYLPLVQKVNSYCLIKMTITAKEQVHGFVLLIQKKNKIAFPSGEYGIIRIIICKLLKERNEYSGYVEYITGKMGQEREIFEERNFDPGDYLIFTELDKNITDSQTVISMYSNGNVTLQELNIKNYPKILEDIYISCAKKQNQVFKFSNDGAPNCLKYSNTSAEGYTYIYIENNEEDTTLIENVNYTKFEGLKLLEPFTGTSYKVSVGPGKRQIVLIKQLELSGYNLIFSYHSNFQFGEKSILNLTKTKGKVKYRKDPKLNIDVNIIVYTYKHSLGLCYYYENNTEDRRLEETLSLCNIIGVEIVGEEKGKNKIVIKLDPGQTKFVELRANKTNWSVQSSVSYKIENIENLKNQKK